MNNAAQPKARSHQSAIERTSAMPAWGQVLRDLRRRIDSGELSQGARLPAENHLAEQYGVSRITIRRALANLAADGYIDRRHGTGTFVSERAEPVHHDLLLEGSWRERLEAAQHTTHSEAIVSQIVTEVPPPVVSALADVISNENLDQEWVYLERVQRVDGHSIGLSESWLPAQAVPGLETEPLVDGSLGRALATRFGIKPDQVDNRLLADQAGAREAELLESFIDVPTFVVVALTRREDGSLLELSRTAWLASRVRFRAVWRAP
ncbi:MAG: GntR family transcriptional regulator [Propioniciclava sp.]